MRGKEAPNACPGDSFALLCESPFQILSILCIHVNFILFVAFLLPFFR